MISVDRTKPPKAGPPKNVRFPDYQETALANGMRVLSYNRTTFPIVTANVVFRHGSYFDGNIPGTASMTSELLTKGTTTRSATQIVEEIESLGGTIASGSGWDNLSLGLSTLSRNFKAGLGVVQDVVRQPAFAEDELIRLAEQRIAMIHQKKANPSALAHQQLQRAIFRDHPYEQPVEGEIDTIKGMTPQQLAEFYQSALSPEQMFVIAVGDVEHDALVNMADAAFGGLPRVAEATVPERAPLTPQQTTVQIVDRPNAVQSSIVAGHIGIPRNHKDFVPVAIMNTLLGGYFGSRLNLNLREDKGFTYGAHSRFEGRLQPGPFYVSTEVGNDVTAPAVREIIGEMQRLVTELVSDEELNGVQRYITGNFPIQIETPSQVAQRIVNIELYGLGKDYYSLYNQRVLEVTPDEIARVAKQYLHPERLVIVIAGKAELLAPQLEVFGAVEVYDTDGNRISTT